MEARIKETRLFPFPESLNSLHLQVLDNSDTVLTRQPYKHFIPISNVTGVMYQESKL